MNLYGHQLTVGMQRMRIINAKAGDSKEWLLDRFAYIWNLKKGGEREATSPVLPPGPSEDSGLVGGRKEKECEKKHVASNTQGEGEAEKRKRMQKEV